jgi:hypothetical protein
MTEYNRYNNGKIYKLISPNTTKIYVGSTCKKYLSQRLTTHKGHYNFWLKNNKGYMASYELFKLGNVEIVLLESVNCNSKDELLKKEREYIEKYKDILININQRPIITKDERKQYRKQHTEDNIEEIKQYKKEHYEKNKEEINERRGKIHICNCGTKYTHRNKSRHEKSTKHQKYINLSNQSILETQQI